LQVRRAVPGDCEKIADLAKDLTQTFTFDHASMVQNFTKLLSIPNATLLVAEQDEDLVGYLLGYEHLTFWANGSVWWVEELMVAEGCRGQGIGRALMGGFEERCRQAGGSLVCLTTRRAAPFYQAIGYQEFATYFRKVMT